MSENFWNVEYSALDRSIITAASIIKSGGIVVAPFDTVYGFICDPKNSQALDRIFRLKERPLKQTIGIASDCFENIQRVATISHPDFIQKRLPGKYTFLLNAKGKAFSPLCYKNETIAVRVPDSQLILKIIADSGGFVAQTSANKSGQKACFSLQELRAQFKQEELDSIDFIIDGGEIRNGNPSQIIDLTKENPIRIERN